MIVGAVRSRALEEDWCWDSNKGTAAVPERGPLGLGKVGRVKNWALPEWASQLILSGG